MAYRARDLEWEVLELRKQNERLREAAATKAEVSLLPFRSGCPGCGRHGDIDRRFVTRPWPFRQREFIAAFCRYGCRASWKERTARMEAELEEQRR